jgi:uncharacterized protein
VNALRAGLLSAVMLVAALAGVPARAQDVLPVPALSGRVIDQTATLSEPQRAALEAKLAAFEAQAGPQIVLLLVPTTAPEDISSYAQRVADSWKIGRRQVGDGLLLLVAKNDRAVRIEVAKALEGAVPDLAARQIIDRAIVPAFRANDYAGGLDGALDLLIGRVRGEGLPMPEVRGGSGARSKAGGLPFEQLGLAAFAGVVLLGGLISAVIGRKAGSAVAAVAAGGAAWWLGTGLLIALGAAFAAVLVVGVVGVGNLLQLLLMMSGRGGGGGGFGGGGGGGGFSSGGGGDFGGGGASGRW